MTSTPANSAPETPEHHSNQPVIPEGRKAADAMNPRELRYQNTLWHDHVEEAHHQHHDVEHTQHALESFLVLVRTVAGAPEVVPPEANADVGAVTHAIDELESLASEHRSNRNQAWWTANGPRYIRCRDDLRNAMRTALTHAFWNRKGSDGSNINTKLNSLLRKVTQGIDPVTGDFRGDIFIDEVIGDGSAVLNQMTEQLTPADPDAPNSIKGANVAPFMTLRGDIRRLLAAIQSNEIWSRPEFNHGKTVAAMAAEVDDAAVELMPPITDLTRVDKFNASLSALARAMHHVAHPLNADRRPKNFVFFNEDQRYAPRNAIENASLAVRVAIASALLGTLLSVGSKLVGGGGGGAVPKPSKKPVPADVKKTEPSKTLRPPVPKNPRIDAKDIDDLSK